MSRYDVYESRESNSYLLDVQTDLLSGLNTRVVVPLMTSADAPRPAGRLNPTFELNGVSVVMVTQFMAAVPVKELKQAVDNFGEHYQEITEALDMLFQGF